MESSLKFLLDLAILLLGSQVGGVISKKFNQPAVLGQIIMGVLLGLGMIEKTEFISHMSEIGVVFLMFIAGLETDVEDLRSSIKSSSAIALGGVVGPLLLVGGVTYIITGNMTSSIFLGVIATATSVGISVQTLKELGHLKSPQGIGILGAAIIDDIVGILLLTLIISTMHPSSGGGVGILILKIVAFFLVTFAIGVLLTKGIAKFKDKLNLENHIVVIGLVTCFSMAYLSEEFGVAAITGAYFAGIILSMTDYRNRISYHMESIGGSMFIPIFFVSIGLGIEFGSLGSALVFATILFVLGIISKIIGCGLGARLSGFTGKQSLQIGIGMIPRAEVAIIIANLGLNLDMIGQNEFATVIILVLGTTLVTPSLLKWSFSRETESEKKENYSLAKNSI